MKTTNQEKMLVLLLRVSGIASIIGGPIIVFGIPFFRESNLLPSVALALQETGVAIPALQQVLGVFLFGLGILLLRSLSDIRSYSAFIMMEVYAHLAIGAVMAFNLFFHDISSLLIELVLILSLVLDGGWGLLVLWLMSSLGYSNQRESTYQSSYSH